MDLNEVHQEQISKYLALLRQKRQRQVREVEEIIAEVHETRCQEDVFNSGDVQSAVDASSAQVVQHVVEEYDRVVGGCAVLLSSYMGGAEGSGLLVETDISTVQDEAALRQVSQLDVGRRSLMQQRSGTLAPLAPVYSNNPDVVREVQELKEENRQWADKLARVQAQVEEVISERERLAMELDSAVQNLEHLKNSQLQGLANPQQDAHLEQVESRLNQEQTLLYQKHTEVEEMKRRQDAMVVQDSAQFKELKKVVAKKNEQIRELRQRLARYEQDDDDALIADD